MADLSSRKKDYSSQVRRKLANSTRTGQACDRCKLRKIRCDADPNGCAGCRAAAEPCETTDRITRKAFRRGHTDQLETENIILKSRLQELQQKLSDMGVPLSPGAFGQETASGDELFDPRPAGGSHLGDSNRTGSLASTVNYSVWQQRMGNEQGALPPNPAFSMLRGTKLSLFGMQIDLADFADDAMDMDSPHTFSGFIWHTNPSNVKEHLHPPQLPPNLKQAREYANWFFKFLNSYTPILDKREMDNLLIEVYNDPRPGPRPGRTAAEEVMLHMMFAYIKYQYGQRNQMQQMADEAMTHFKYCIGFTQEMLRARTFRDIQAMSLILLQLRGLRRPGACWIFGQLTVNLAVECGLHRSADFLAASERQVLSPSDVEARKRVFWALYGLVSNNSSRLGRPPPLRLIDIDIEFPQPVDDFLSSEGPMLSDFHKCSFRVGITIAKLLALSSDLHCTFYTLSEPPSNEYAKLIARFKNDLEVWHSEIPPELSDSSLAENELEMYAMYLDLFEAEFRFLLYHPLLHPPNQHSSYQRTVQACEEAISDAQRLLLRIRDLKSLDVPWHTTTMLLSMTFTQLFVEDQRSADISEDSFHRLESDMSIWLDLFGTVGNMIGSGNHLQTSVGQIIKNVLDKLRVDLSGRNTPGGASAGSFQTAKGYGMRAMPDGKAPQNAYAGAAMSTVPQTPHAYAAQQPQSAYPYGSPHGVYQNPQVPYAPAQQYGAAPAQPKPLPSTQVVPSMSYQTPTGGMQYYPQQQDVHTESSTTTPVIDWIRWSQANLNPFAQQPHHQQEYITPGSANTILPIGGPRSSVSGSTSGQPAQHDTEWPLNYYNGGQFASSHPG